MEWIYKLLFSAELIDGIKEIFITLKDKDEKIFLRILYIVSVISGLLFTAKLWF